MSALVFVLLIICFLPLVGSFQSTLRSRSSAALFLLDPAAKTSSLDTDLPKGLDDGHFIVKSFDCPASFGLNEVFNSRARPELTTPYNVTLPLALMVLDPETYPTLSRARKACRKGNIILDRGGAPPDGQRIRGRAGDRVIAGCDRISVQTRLSNCFYPSLTYAKPPFELPVVYEDDDMAVVNKPAGVVTYSHRKGGHGRLTVRAALPYVLLPPADGRREAVLRRPAPVHRLDKATSGIMIIAKTKQAMVELSRAFAERNVEKSYVALLNGLPDDGDGGSSGGGDDDVGSGDGDDNGGSGDGDDDVGWRTISSNVMGKEAVTKWRVMNYSQSLVAADGYITQVLFKPKTGRFHQLRIHSSEVLGCPIVGDLEHDKGTESALKMRENGMFLCSSSVLLPHPTLKELPEEGEAKRWEGVEFVMKDGKVFLRAEIALPDKFAKTLRREGQRAKKLG